MYRGYVDDPRNTDNAWMETVAYNFHDEEGDGLGTFAFHAGNTTLLHSTYIKTIVPMQYSPFTVH